jgi:hypothetical protein
LYAIAALMKSVRAEGGKLSTNLGSTWRGLSWGLKGRVRVRVRVRASRVRAS